MNNFLSKNLKISVLFLGLTMMSACSSSKHLGESAAPAETVADASAPDASTDQVPAQDANIASAPAPDALDAAPELPPSPPAEGQIADAGSAPMDVPSEPQVVSQEPVSDVASASATPVSEGDAVQYKVKSGDTLMKIAFENYGDLYRWKEIYEANRERIQDPNHIPPGTNLSLNGAGMVTIERNGERYLIKHGDTLGVISQDVYGTTRKWKKLWENNRQLIKDPNKIYAGFYLYYQPEGRLTHEESQDVNPATSEAPAVIENPSAAVKVTPGAVRVPASK